MSLKSLLADEDRTAASKRRIAHEAMYSLHGAALAAHVSSAVKSAAARSKHRVSEWERDALIQAVTVSALRSGSLAPTWAGKRTAPTRAADVLAWIDLAERRPLTARRADEARLARGAGTRSHLERLTVARLADSREWRDMAGGYRTRAGHGVPTVSDEALAERPAGGWLTADGEWELPAADLELAESVALAIGGTERECRAMAVALLAALPDPDDGAPLSLVSIAAALGLSHGTARNLASDGARLIRGHVPSGAELAELVRTTAEQRKLAPPSRALRALLSGQPAPLYPSAMLAAWAVEAIRPSYTPSGARSVPEREPRCEGEPMSLPLPSEAPARVTEGDYWRTVTVPEPRRAERDTVSESEADGAWLKATERARCECPACR